VTARSRRAPLLAVDVLGALNIVGMLLAYLSVATLLPAVRNSCSRPICA
jgi:hypothetical protein